MKWWMALVWVGCMPSVTPDKVSDPSALDSAQRDSAEPEPEQVLAVLSTLADDYSVGALATVDLETFAVADTLAPTSGDAVIRTSEDHIVVLNRLNTDTLRLYTPGDWAAPEMELALPDQSNPQDAAWCGGRLWVSLHSADYLPAYTASGRRVARADLSAWAGSDGSAEASGIEVYDGALYVALEQFAQDDAWQSEGGVVVRVDCETAEVSMVIDAAPSPSIASSADAGKIWVRTGVYGELDGSVMALNLQTFETEVVLTEAELGQDITSISGSPSGFVALSVDADWRYGVRCMDEATGVQVQGMQTDSFLSDVAIDDRGRVFITAREGWSDDGSVAPGLHVLDSQTCQPALSAPIQTTLDPYTVSFF